ncbi:putative protein in mobD 3'region [Geobacter sp. OR-1]|uniref:pentapeptide repeat-containing protein n=1 Tax=Geobacter sp. OR-1 TaxID=1266765 RepID=UPI000543CF2D|nr:pentapeptide repeat-containing protein [Geobacter sp. OR-1]GAM09211.1 putative protein in mobD 3'region [Geobacter sp. OR-1]
MRDRKSFGIVLYFAGLVVFMVLQAVAPQEIAAAGEAPSSGAPESEVKSPAGHEVNAVEQTLRRALDKSEADKADLEKKYQELSVRESQARAEAAKLSSEKEEIAKSCKTKETSGDAAKPGIKKSKKRKSVHKWWASGGDADKNASASMPKKVSKLKQNVKYRKKKTGKAKKVASNKNIGCTGPVVSMSYITKAMAGKKNLAGKNLKGMQLVGMNLVGANLKGACLAKTNFERADLAEADLERSDLSGANLKRASLRLANINAAKLDGAILDNAIWTDSRICLEGSVGSCRDLIP